MPFAESAVTAVIVAVFLGLVKGIDYLLTKRNEKNKPPPGLTEDQAKFLSEAHRMVSDIKERGTLTKEQETLLDQIMKGITHLDELHSVYDDNHVPMWYVPSDLKDKLMKILIQVAAMDDHLDEVKEGQGALIRKISDLISSQQLMTQRMGDLISKLDTLNR